MNIRQIWTLAKAAFSSWLDDYAPSMGAALAYYTMFSIAPLLLIVISTAGLVFGEEAVRGEIFGQLQGLMGDQGAQAVQSLLESVSEPKKGMAGTIIGSVLLLIGATTVFAELQDAFDRIWRAPDKDKTGGVLQLIRSRLLSFGIILGIGFLMIVSLVFSAAIAALGKWWGPLFSNLEVIATVVNFVFSFALMTAVFAMLYKFMPRVKIHWKDVWAGATVTALLFTVGKILIGLYIGKSAISSGFGAAGSLVVVLVWVYYSAQIFLLGAEFTWVYAHAHGSQKDESPSGRESGSLPRKGQMRPKAEELSQ
jgi:membrane protein